MDMCTQGCFGGRQPSSGVLAGWAWLEMGSSISQTACFYSLDDGWSGRQHNEPTRRHLWLVERRKQEVCSVFSLQMAEARECSRCMEGLEEDLEA